MTDTIWTDIGALDQIPRRGARVVRTPQACVAVFRTVTCPPHNWVMSLETGEAQGADEGRAATFPLKVEEGRILLDLSTLADRPPRGKAS
jgi:nitrite reductase (NADH) small subunit